MSNSRRIDFSREDPPDCGHNNTRRRGTQASASAVGVQARGDTPKDAGDHKPDPDHLCPRGETVVRSPLCGKGEEKLSSAKAPTQRRDSRHRKPSKWRIGCLVSDDDMRDSQSPDRNYTMECIYPRDRSRSRSLTSVRSESQDLPRRSLSPRKYKLRSRSPSPLLNRRLALQM